MTIISKTALLSVLVVLSSAILIQATDSNKSSTSDKSGWGGDKPYVVEAYLKSLRNHMKAYPNDLDAAVLYVETLLARQDGRYWQDDRVTPTQETQEAIRVLNYVLAKKRDHSGALKVVQHLKLHHNLIPFVSAFN